MLRSLLTPFVLLALLAPARAGDPPSAAVPASAASTPASGAAEPCECGGPGKCCGGQTAAPLAATGDKPATERSCGCGAGKKTAQPATK